MLSTETSGDRQDQPANQTAQNGKTRSGSVTLAHGRPFTHHVQGNTIHTMTASKHNSTDHPGQHPAFAWDGDTLVLYILGKPSDKQDAIGKIHGNQLRVSVTAAPRSGKATDHMVRFLAKQFGVTPSDIEVVSGRMNVNKKLRIKAPRQLPGVITPRETP
jgi:uncharacterized protein (TIGR00251 family)